MTTQSNYVQITLDLSRLGGPLLDLAVPRQLTVKRLLHEVNQSYQLGYELVSPICRNLEYETVLFATDRIGNRSVRDGVTLQLEQL